MNEFKFQGNGKICHNINECHLGACDENADCRDTIGSYQCTCKAGFKGDGKRCELERTILGFGTGLMRSGRNQGAHQIGAPNLIAECTTNPTAGYAGKVLF